MAGNRVISAVLTLKDKDFGSTAKKSASAMTDFQRKTQHSANTVKSFGKSATSSFKSIATGAASILTAIGVTKALSGAFNMVKSSLGSAMDRIDTMEQFERVMGVMVDDTDAVAESMSRMNHFLTGTSMRMDTMASSVQNFVTRGMNIDKATNTVEAWGNAVSFYGDGSSEQFESVSTALQNMVASGKVGGNELNTLFAAGIPAVDIYADAVGKLPKDIQKALTKGEISAEKFVDTVSIAMMEGTKKFPEISSAMQDMGASWGSIMANIGAYVSIGTKDIIDSIDEMLTDNGLPDMRGMIDNFAQSFGSALSGIADKVPIATNYLVGLYEKSKPGIDWIKDTAMPALQEGIGFATSKAKEMYNFFVTNWPVIGPIIAGVAATVAAFKVGIIAITAAQTTWAAVTSAVQIATALLNGTLALSPLGWVALAIGAVVAAGIALYQNWDTVKAAASSLWQKLLDNPMLALVAGPFGALIAAGITLYQNFDKIKAAFNAFKTAISNFKLPKWVSTIGSTLSNAAQKVGGLFSRGGPQASYAVGTNRVPHDMVAQIHKDEMIVPATQSHNLRKQGVTIDNIDKGGMQRSSPVRVASAPQTIQSDASITSMIAQLIQAIKDMPKGDIKINVNGTNLTVQEIVDELAPLLKLRIANL